MPNEELLDQARYIFATGKMIRDRIFRIHSDQVANAGKIGRHGELSLSQIHAVMVTRDRGEITITELADKLGVSPPSASAMVDRLFAKGILKREHSREDRRKVVVSVSPEAIKDCEKIEGTILQSFVELVEKIGPETARKWCEVLERVKEVQEDGHCPASSKPTAGR